MLVERRSGVGPRSDPREQLLLNANQGGFSARKRRWTMLCMQCRSPAESMATGFVASRSMLPYRPVSWWRSIASHAR